MIKKLKFKEEQVILKGNRFYFTDGQYLYFRGFKPSRHRRQIYFDEIKKPYSETHKLILSQLKDEDEKH